MSKRVKKKRTKTNKLKLTYEYVPTPDGKRRLAEAYEMIFEKLLAEKQKSKRKSS